MQMDVITATDTTINTHNTASPIGLPHPIESAAPPETGDPLRCYSRPHATLRYSL
ncbi:hypothetical protein GCM10009773_06660 [Williamsia serinedens]